MATQIRPPKIGRRKVGRQLILTGQHTAAVAGGVNNPFAKITPNVNTSVYIVKNRKDLNP